MDLKQKVKELPSCPGVYLMKDAQGSVIYVGKSKNLKSRVGSYFQSSKAHPPKVVKMVRHLRDFEIILTDTEFEALMLECRLIKEIRPLYNRLMNRDQSYVYLRIKINEAYPEIEISKESEKVSGDLYFGPYTNKNTVIRGLQGIKECCRVLCTGKPRKNSTCLNHALGLCIGVCSDDTLQTQYLAFVEKLVKLLRGADTDIMEELSRNMKLAADRYDFEGAAKYRDYLSAVKHLLGRNKVIEFTEVNKNIAVLEPLSEDSVKLFLIKGSRVIFNEKYALSHFCPGTLNGVLKTRILTCFSGQDQSAASEIGKEEIDMSQIIYTYLKGKDSSCRYAIIPKSWLGSPDNPRFDKALNKLLAAE